MRRMGSCYSIAVTFMLLGHRWKERIMKSIVRLVAIAAFSALLVMGIAGCGSSSASSSASASSGSGEAVSNTASDASGSADSDKATTTNSKSSSSASQTTSSGSASLGASQRFGNAKTGYVSVPSDWKDFTSKLDARTVEASAMTYLVDPTTEFTSAVESHWSYSSSIKLETYPCKYTEKADELLYKYRGETSNYKNPEIQKMTFNGKNASVLKCSSADNVDIANIAIEKDANSCILITTNSTSSTDEAVLSYAATWSMDK